MVFMSWAVRVSIVFLMPVSPWSGAWLLARETMSMPDLAKIGANSGSVWKTVELTGTSPAIEIMGDSKLKKVMLGD